MPHSNKTEALQQWKARHTRLCTRRLAATKQAHTMIAHAVLMNVRMVGAVAKWPPIVHVSHLQLDRIFEVFGRCRVDDIAGKLQLDHRAPVRRRQN